MSPVKIKQGLNAFFMTFIAPHETNYKAVSSSLSGTLKTSKVEVIQALGPQREAS